MRRILMAAGWLLPLILGALFLIKGQRYDSDYFEPSALDVAVLPVPLALNEWVLEGGEFLPADRMFEKINGKAAYYHQYGATGLCSGEWIANGQRWDMYLYSFAEGQGARGAYAGERPADGVAIEGVEGYTVPGQAGMAAGSFYLQLNAQTANADPGRAVELAKALVPYLGGAADDAPAEAVVDLMALAGADAVSEAEEFLPESAFGFSSLEKVRTAKVVLDDAEVIWFTLPGDSELVAAYAEELAMYGGEELFTEGGASGGSMFGSWGVAGVVNGEVWGVQNAPSRAALMLHWATLQERLGETP